MNRNHRFALFALAPLALTLGACADMLIPAHVEGEVDRNEVPPLRDSFFAAVKFHDKFAIFSMATTYDDACARQTDSVEAILQAKRRFGKKAAEAYAAQDQAMLDDAQAQLVSDLEDANAEPFPDQHWSISALVAVEEEDDLDGESFEIEDSEDALLQVRVCRQNDRPELDNTGQDENADCFVADNGDVSIESYERSDVSLHAIVDLVDAEDVDADVGNNVEIDLRAPRCADIEDPLVTFFENACPYAFDESCDEEPDANGNIYCSPGTDTADCD